MPDPTKKPWEQNLTVEDAVTEKKPWERNLQTDDVKKKSWYSTVWRIYHSASKIGFGNEYWFFGWCRP